MYTVVLRRRGGGGGGGGGRERGGRGWKMLWRLHMHIHTCACTNMHAHMHAHNTHTSTRTRHWVEELSAHHQKQTWQAKISSPNSKHGQCKRQMLRAYVMWCTARLWCTVLKIKKGFHYLNHLFGSIDMHTMQIFETCCKIQNNSNSYIDEEVPAICFITSFKVMNTPFSFSNWLSWQPITFGHWNSTS